MASLSELKEEYFSKIDQKKHSLLKFFLGKQREKNPLEKKEKVDFYPFHMRNKIRKVG